MKAILALLASLTPFLIYCKSCGEDQIDYAFTFCLPSNNTRTGIIKNFT